MDINEFAEPGEKNDRVIQMALREVEVPLMSDWMTSLSSDEREIIYRNMSERASRLLAADVEEKGESVPRHAAERAGRVFLQKLAKFRRYLEHHPPRAVPDTPPALDFTSPEHLVASLIELARFARVRGLLEVGAATLPADQPIARKALELTVDGWDALEKREILERMKEISLARQARMIDIVIDGFDLIGGSDHELTMQERLRAYLEP